MTTAANGRGAVDTELGRLPVDSLSYEDLYRRWERGNWSAMDFDFTEDASQWREDFTEFERRAAIWNYALFIWGEDVVAQSLSPYIDAAPLEEQKYFLTTQQVDEARHAVFFKRFMQEVCGIGDGAIRSSLQAIRPELTPGYVQIFGRLETMAKELRRSQSKSQLAAGVTLYHLVIEATMAQPAQHMICSYLNDRDVLPAFREGMERVAADEQRHIGFGVKLLSDLNREAPGAVREAVAKLLREVTLYLAQVLMPPDWDERYVTTFGVNYDDVGLDGLASLTGKLRAAGLAVDTLPGPPVLPPGLEPLELAQRGRALAQAGVIGIRQGPSRRDPETIELLFDTLRRQANPDHGLRKPTTFQWEFSDPDIPPWHLTIDGGRCTVRQGIAARPDLRLLISYQDWIDIIGRRLSPLKAVAFRRLRTRGNPLALRALLRVFPRT